MLFVFNIITINIYNVGLQIKLNNTDLFDKWLRDFILFMVAIDSHNPDLIWKSAVNAFLKHRNDLGKYWNHIFLLYRAI